MLKVAGAILLVALAVGVAYIGTRPTELEKFDACMIGYSRCTLLL